MKLSKQTIQILKNFQSINSNLAIKEGNVLSTASTTRTVYAEALVEETFPIDFGVYDLSELLSVISIFDSPELTFGSEELIISEGKNRVKYRSASSEVLVAPKKRFVFPVDSIDESFELTQTDLNQLSRLSSVMKLPIVSIRGDGEKIKIVLTDKETPLPNEFLIEKGETDKHFDINIKVEFFKMLPETYELNISSRLRACQLVGNDKMYVMSWEIDSSFGE